MSRLKKFSIHFVCIVVAVIAMKKITLGSQIIKDDISIPSKNTKSSKLISASIKVKNTVDIKDNTHTDPLFNPSATNIKGDVNDYLHENEAKYTPFKLAEILHDNGYDREAEDTLLKIIRENIDEEKDVSINMLQLLRKIMHSQGRLSEYHALLSSIPNEYPRKPLLLSEMGEYLSRQGNGFEAEIVFIGGIEQYPDNYFIWDSYASFLKSEGRINEAESAYRQILEIQDSPETRFELQKLLEL